MADNAETPTITASESKVLISMMKHLQGDITTDWDAVTKECGFKNAASAKTRWRQIRNAKIMPVGGIDKASPSKKVNGPKKIPADDGQKEGDDEEAKPKAKSGRKPKAKKGELTAENDVEDAEKGKDFIKSEARDEEDNDAEDGSA